MRSAAPPARGGGILFDFPAERSGGARSVVPHRLPNEGSVDLVLDLVADASHPHVLEDEAGPLYLTALRHLVATALAACHRLPALPDLGGALQLAKAAPWVFDLARPAPASLRELAPAQLSVIQGIQAQPDVLAALERLRDEWRPSGLVMAT